MGYTDEQKTAIANSIRSGNVGSSTPTSSSGGGTGGYTDEQKTAIANAIRSGQGSIDFTTPTQTTVADILANPVNKLNLKNKQLEQAERFNPYSSDPAIAKLQRQKDVILNGNGANDPLAQRGLAELDKQIELAQNPVQTPVQAPAPVDNAPKQDSNTTLDKLQKLQEQKNAILNSEDPNHPLAKRGIAEIDRQMLELENGWLEDNYDTLTDNYLRGLGLPVDDMSSGADTVSKIAQIRQLEIDINAKQDEIDKELDPVKKEQLIADQDAMLLQLDEVRDSIVGGEKAGVDSLRRPYNAVTSAIEQITNQYISATDPQEKERLAYALELLNDRQAKLMNALGIEKKPLVEWEGRAELLAEYRRLDDKIASVASSEDVDPADAARHAELKNLLQENDLMAGNGWQSYTPRERVGNVIEGAGRNIGSSIINAGATILASGQPDLTLGEQVRVAAGTADEKALIEAKKGNVDEITTKMWDTADSISDNARINLEAAKSELGTVGSALVDIGENVIEMGFDAGVGAVTGGASLASMFVRVFGSSTQEARRAGASLDKQVAYGLTKAGIEVATEKMFDGVAKIYGAGAADDITEKLIGKLTDNDVGRSFLRIVAGGVGEGSEEVISDLLAPLAESIYKDETTRELYSQLDPADVLYSFIIGATIGILGGGTNVATGGNAAANYQLRQSEAGVGSVENQMSGAWDVLTGARTADEVNLTESRARERLGLDANGNPVTSAPATEVVDALSESPAESPTVEAHTINPAQQALLDTISNGVTNKVAETIMNDPALKAEFESIADVVIEGTKSEQRNIVKDNADAVIDALLASIQNKSVTTISNILAAEKLLDMLQFRLNPATGKISDKGATEIRDNPVLRAAFEEATGVKLTGKSANQTRIIRDSAAAAVEALKAAGINPITTSIDTDPANHTPEVQQEIDRFVKAVDTKLIEWFGKVRNLLNGGTPHDYNYKLGPVSNSEAESIQQLTGVDTRGFEHNLNGEVWLNHIDAEHGGKGSTNKSMRHDEDVARMEYIIRNHDTIELALDKNGNPAKDSVYNDSNNKAAPRVIYSKKLDGTYYLVEAIPNSSSKTLQVVSAYIVPNEKKGAQSHRSGTPGAQVSDANPEGGPYTPDFTSETGLPPPSGDSVSQSPVKSNNNSDNNPPSGPSAPGGTSADSDVDSGETRERGESRNIRTDEARDQQLRDFKEKNPDIYKVVKNEKTLGKALDIFETQGVEGSAATLEQALADARNGKKLSLEMVPLHKLVCDELAKSGQIERANRISSDLGAELTYAGQLNQANVILRNSSATAKADAFAKTLDKMIGENKAAIDQESVQDLVDRYRAAETDEARNAVLDDAITAIAQSSPSNLRDMFTALRYTNMLGNFKTQIRNVLGNTGMLLAARGKNRVLAVEQAAVNAVSNMLGKGNAVTRTNTLTTDGALFKEAWKMFAEDQKAAYGEGKYSDVAQGNQAIREKKTVFKWNWKGEADTKLGQFGRAAADVPMKVLEGYRKATSWAMEQGDVIFQKVTYAQVLADYAKAQGYKSLADVPAEQLQTMREYAIKEAQEATFHDKNAVSEAFSNFDRNWSPLGKKISQGIMPFRQTPANVGVRMEEYSPLGLINTFVDAARLAKGTTDVNSFMNTLAKTISGTGLAALGYILAKNGLARGKEDDEKLANYERNVQGLGDYSLVLPDGTTVSLDWLQPESAAFFVGVEAAKYFDDGVQADDFLSLLGSTTDIALNMSFLSGLNDTLGKVASTNGNVEAIPSLLLNSFLSYAGQGLTNSLAGQAEQASEQYRQTTYTDPNSPIPQNLQKIIGKMSAKTPGIDYNQADYIDAWGRRQDNGPAAGRIAESFFSPAYINENRSTEVDDELKRLHEAVGNEIEGTVFPSSPARSTEINGVRLSPEEYDVYATTGGQKALELVTDFINSPGYEDLDDKTKAETIKKLYGYARVDAKNAVLDARGEEPVTDSGYERAKAVMNAGNLSWGEYFDIDKNRDMDGNGSPGQEETAQYLFDSGMSDEEAENVYNVYYPNAKTPYSEWAEGFRTVANSNFSREEFDALTDSITEEKKDKEPWDSAGNSAVVDAVLGAVDSGLSDEAAVSLIIDNTSKNYSNPFSALIDDGHSLEESMDFLGRIDQPGADGTPPNRSIEQKELIAFYKEHPEEEVLIALVWDSMGYTGKNTKDFATYKGSLK